MNRLSVYKYVSMLCDVPFYLFLSLSPTCPLSNAGSSAIYGRFVHLSVEYSKDMRTLLYAYGQYKLVTTEGKFSFSF